jgi:microcystin degradation protein MlrC
VRGIVRIAIGQLMEESNTFVRQQADLDHFRANQLLLGDDVTRLRGTRAEVGGFLEALGRAGAEVVRRSPPTACRAARCRGRPSRP